MGSRRSHESRLTLRSQKPAILLLLGSQGMSTLSLWLSPRSSIDAEIEGVV